MISLICFLLTLAGSINWFCIGVLQYDYIAGLFGSQANVFSRIIYALIGLSSIWLVFALIKGKGKLKIDGKRSSDKSLLLSKKKKAANAEASQMANPTFNGISNHPGLYNQPNQMQNYNYSQPGFVPPQNMETNNFNTMAPPQNQNGINDFDEQN